MNKFEFYKNNIMEELDGSITYNVEEKIFVRETDEYLIILDFLKKQCQFTLKEHKLSLNIRVLEMDFFIEDSYEIFNYILETEPEVKNTIKIKNKD